VIDPPIDFRLQVVAGLFGTLAEFLLEFVRLLLGQVRTFRDVRGKFGDLVRGHHGQTDAGQNTLLEYIEHALPPHD